MCKGVHRFSRCTRRSRIRGKDTICEPPFVPSGRYAQGVRSTGGRGLWAREQNRALDVFDACEAQRRSDFEPTCVCSLRVDRR